MEGTESINELNLPRGSTGPIRRHQPLSQSQPKSGLSRNRTKSPYERRPVEDNNNNDNSLLNMVSNKLLNPIRRIFSPRPLTLQRDREDRSELHRQVTLDMEEGRLGKRDDEKEIENFALLRAKRPNPEPVQPEYSDMTDSLSKLEYSSDPIGWKSNDAGSIIEAYREALARQTALEQDISIKPKPVSKSPSPVIEAAKAKPTKKSRLSEKPTVSKKRINELKVYRQIRRGPSRLPHPTRQNNTSSTNETQQPVSINDITNPNAPKIISIQRVAKPLIRLEDIPQDRINRPGIFSAELEYSSDEEDTKIINGNNNNESLLDNDNKDIVRHFKPTNDDVPFSFPSTTTTFIKPDVSTLFKRPTEENPAAVNKRNLINSTVPIETTKINAPVAILNSPVKSQPPTTFMAPSAGFKIAATSVDNKEDEKKENKPLFGGIKSLETKPAEAKSTEAKPFTFGSKSTEANATEAKSLFGATKPTETKSLFGATKPTEAKSLFGSTKPTETKSLFGSTSENKPAAGSDLLGAPAPGAFSFGASETKSPEITKKVSLFNAPDSGFTFTNTQPSATKVSSTTITPESTSKSSSAPKSLFDFGSISKSAIATTEPPTKAPLSLLGGAPKGGMFSFSSKPADADNTPDKVPVATADKPFSFSLGKSDDKPITSNSGLSNFNFGASTTTSSTDDDEQKKKQKRRMSNEESAPPAKIGTITPVTTTTTTTSAPTGFGGFSFGATKSAAVTVPSIPAALETTTETKPVTTFYFGSKPTTPQPLFGATPPAVVSPAILTPTSAEMPSLSLGFGSSAKPAFTFGGNNPTTANSSTPSGTATPTGVTGGSAASGFSFGSTAVGGASANGSGTTTPIAPAATTATTVPVTNAFGGFGSAANSTTASTINIPDIKSTSNISNPAFSFGANKPPGMSLGNLGSASSPNMFGMGAGTVNSTTTTPNPPAPFNFGGSGNSPFGTSSQPAPQSVASPGLSMSASTPSFAFGAPAQQAPPPAAVFGFGQPNNNNPMMGMTPQQQQQQQQAPNMFNQGAPPANAAGPAGRRMAPMRGRLRRR